MFSAVCVCDDRQIAQYSNEERVRIRARLTADDWINAPNEPPESRDWFMHQLNSLSNSTDSQSSGGFHALFINYQTCYENVDTLYFMVQFSLLTTHQLRLKYTSYLLLINS